MALTKLNVRYIFMSTGFKYSLIFGKLLTFLSQLYHQCQKNNTNNKIKNILSRPKI